MVFSAENGSVSVHASELSAYAIKKNTVSASGNESGFSRVTSEPCYDSITEYVELSSEYGCGDVNYSISASADRILIYDGIATVELSRSVKRLPFRFVSSYNAELLAEGVVAAFVFCRQMSTESVILRLTFVSRDSGETVSFEREYSISFLEKMTDVLLSRAEPFVKVFIERKTLRPEEIKKLAFPYGKPRGGQEELMLAVMKAIRKGEKLIASAPTGTGKTMATLFPSVKALGENYIDRIFYLTGKTVTGKAALDAMSLLAESAPHLRCIAVHSKERVCVNREAETCFACPRMNEITSENGEALPYKTRRDAALAELLDSCVIYDGKTVAACAERHSVCPYELSLDLSEFCDVIVCDYNYVFDTKVRFQRYFVEDRGEKYAFLVDEAHNLPDRVRASYTASFGPSDLALLTEFLKDVPADELGRAVSEVRKAFDEIKELCAAESTVVTDKDGDHSVGYYKTDKIPEKLLRTAVSLGKVCRAAARDNDSLKDAAENISDKASALFSASTVSDDGFAFLAQTVDGELTCRYICLDPSPIIEKMCEGAHSSVMFSATLEPVDYFTDVLGCRGAGVVRAESPFDPDNLSVTVFDGISTRLTDRSDTAADVAEVIATVTEAKTGKYLVYFPSYKYMKTVLREYLNLCPDTRAVMQKPDMTHSDREKFLSVFRNEKYDSVVGFCVLGGVFSEGIDLAGDDLIGVIIVGAGLPGISAELNLIAEYCENKYGSGHLYAYEYPALNHVSQAAGRVIRTAEDRGVVVLVDHRMSSPDMVSKLPEHWRGIACTSDTDTLSVILERFWKKF
ncbi:MAG: ATP-dependent DNA helicase [Clostridia bacterium]|nr:ATP-dependent DNA helicase [Clostridia bacterium]